VSTSGTSSAPRGSVASKTTADASPASARRKAPTSTRANPIERNVADTDEAKHVSTSRSSTRNGASQRTLELGSAPQPYLGSAHHSGGVVEDDEVVSAYTGFAVDEEEVVSPPKARHGAGRADDDEIVSPPKPMAAGQLDDDTEVVSPPKRVIRVETSPVKATVGRVDDDEVNGSFASASRPDASPRQQAPSSTPSHLAPLPPAAAAVSTGRGRPVSVISESDSASSRSESPSLHGDATELELLERSKTGSRIVRIDSQGRPMGLRFV
jgi:hypothetical protein